MSGYSYDLRITAEQAYSLRFKILGILAVLTCKVLSFLTFGCYKKTYIGGYIYIYAYLYLMVKSERLDKIVSNMEMEHKYKQEIDKNNALNAKLDERGE